MKTKNCELCKLEQATLYRIKITNSKVWIFVCTACCQKSQTLENYKYGGTWKGKRH